MPRDSLIDIEGTITDALGGGQYSIKSNDGDKIIRGQLGGRMKKHHIRVVPGDNVTISVSPYDLSHGIITHRRRF